MRIVIAPDKFKGTLTADEACAAIAAGAHDALPGAEVEICPMSDGGEGFLACIRATVGGSWVSCRAPDPRGREIEALWLQVDAHRGAAALLGLAESLISLAGVGLIGDLSPVDLGAVPGRLAIIESARVIGLARSDTAARDPERLTTAGLYHLLVDAHAQDCDRSIIGLGGSATVDGGVGLAGALGAALYDARGGRLPAAPASLTLIDRVVIDERMLRGDAPRRIIAACDVANPLLGLNGAARVFGPQKGATPVQVERLEAGLANWARVVREAGLDADPDEPGAGAAGGLGFALRAFLGAKLVPGIEVAMELAGFRDRLARADLVITGEGRLDAQTTGGKVIAGVARAATQRGVPTVAVVGDTGGEPAAIAASMAAAGAPLAHIERLVDHAASLADARARAAELLRSAAASAITASLNRR